MKAMKECGECKEKWEKKKIKRINKKWVCIYCYRKRRDKNRDHILHTVAGVRRRSDLEKGWRERSKARKEKEQKELGPMIPGAKQVKERIKKVPALGLYLTKVEKEVLVKKYVSNGMEYHKAYAKLKECMDFLYQLIQRLREKGKSEEEIDKKVKEEYANLMEED